MGKTTVDKEKTTKQIRLRPAAYTNAVKINAKQREKTGETISLETTVNEILIQAKV